MFFINFFITLFIIIIVSLFTKPPEDIVRLHEELFRKVPIETGEKTVMETRAKSQAENVADFLIEKGLA